jgi:hypothetical protein
MKQCALRVKKRQRDLPNGIQIARQCSRAVAASRLGYKFAFCRAMPSRN